jgi:hypothetical protein
MVHITINIRITTMTTTKPQMNTILSLIEKGYTHHAFLEVGDVVEVHLHNPSNSINILIVDHNGHIVLP